VKLPDNLLKDHFDLSFHRGMILRYLMKDPDDPAISERHKYALVANLDTTESESFLLLTTSRLEKATFIRATLPDAFHEFSVGSYQWVTVPTLLDLRSVKRYVREDLVRSIQAQTLTFEGQLNDNDMTEIDQKLKVSRTIEKIILRRIVLP
jgi:hypothetical protein